MLQSTKKWKSVQDHLVQKWSAVPNIKGRLKTFFIDPNGRIGINLFSKLDMSISVDLGGDVARNMSLEVNGMTVYQIQYHLMPIIANQSTPPLSANMCLPFPVAGIGSRVLTPTLTPNTVINDSAAAVLNAPLPVPTRAVAAPSTSVQHPVGIANTNQNTCQLEVHEDFVGLDTNASLHISDDTIASMLHACANTNTQFSASTNGHEGVSEVRSLSAPDSVKTRVANSDEASAITSCTSSSCSFRSPQKPPKASTAVVANNDVPKLSAPACNNFARWTKHEEKSSKDGVENILTFSDNTVDNVLSIFCGDNSLAAVSSAPSEGDHEPKISKKAVEQPEVCYIEPVARCVESSLQVASEEKDIDAKSSSTGGIVSMPKRGFSELDLQRSSQGERSIRRKKMRRITPTFMGPLTEVHRFVVQHFPVR